MQSIIIIHYPLYDTAMIICKGGPKTVRGGPLYDTAVIICKGGPKTVRGPLYDTAVIICKGGSII